MKNPELISLGMKERILVYAASPSSIAIGKAEDFSASCDPWPMNSFHFVSLPIMDNHRGSSFHRGRPGSSSSLYTTPRNDAVTVVQVHPTKDYLCVGTECSGLYLTKASHPVLSSETRLPLKLTGDTIHSACFLTTANHEGEEQEDERTSALVRKRCSTTTSYVELSRAPPMQQQRKRSEDYLAFSSSLTSDSHSNGSSHRLSLWSITEDKMVWRCASEPFHSMSSFYSTLSFVACSSDNFVQVYTVKKRDSSFNNSAQDSRDSDEEVGEGREWKKGTERMRNKIKKTITKRNEKEEEEENHPGEILLWSLTCATPDVGTARPRFVSCATFPPPSHSIPLGGSAHERTSSLLLNSFKPGGRVGEKKEKTREKSGEAVKKIERRESPHNEDFFFVALTVNGFLVEYDRRNGSVRKWMGCKDPQATAVLTSRKYITVCGSAVRYFRASTWEFSGMYQPLEARSWSGSSPSSLLSSSSSACTVAVSSLIFNEFSRAVVLLRDGSIFTFQVSENPVSSKGDTTSKDTTSSRSREVGGKKLGQSERCTLHLEPLYHYAPLVDPQAPRDRRGPGGAGMQVEGEERRAPGGSNFSHFSGSSTLSFPRFQWVQASVSKNANGSQQGQLPCAIWCSMGIRALDCENLNIVRQYPLRFTCGVYDPHRNILFAQCRQTNEIHALNPCEMWNVSASVPVSLPLVSLAISPEGLVAGLGENQMLYFFFCRGKPPSISLEVRQGKRNLSGIGPFHEILFAGEKLYAKSNTYLMNTSSNKEYHWKEKILQIAPVDAQNFLLLFSNYCELFDPGDPDEHSPIFSLPFTATTEASMKVEDHHHCLVLIEQAGQLLVFELHDIGVPLLFFDYSTRNPGKHISLAGFIQTKRDKPWRLLVADSDAVVSIYSIFDEGELSSSRVEPSYKDSTCLSLQQPPLAPHPKTPLESGKLIKAKHSETGSSSYGVKDEEGDPNSKTTFFSSISGLSSSKKKHSLSSNALASSHRAPNATEMTAPMVLPVQDEPTSLSNPLTHKGDQNGERGARTWRRDSQNGKRGPEQDEDPREFGSSMSSVPCCEELNDRLTELTSFFQSQAMHSSTRSARRQLRRLNSIPSFSDPPLYPNTHISSENCGEEIVFHQERKEERRETDGEKSEKETQKESEHERKPSSENDDGRILSSHPSPTPSPKSPTSTPSKSLDPCDPRGGSSHSHASLNESTTPVAVPPPVVSYSIRNRSPTGIGKEENNSSYDIFRSGEGASDFPYRSSSPCPAKTRKERLQTPLNNEKGSRSENAGVDNGGGTEASKCHAVASETVLSHIRVGALEVEVSPWATQGTLSQLPISTPEAGCELTPDDDFQPVTQEEDPKSTLGSTTSSSSFSILENMDDDEEVNPRPFPEQFTACAPAFGMLPSMGNKVVASVIHSSSPVVEDEKNEDKPESSIKNYTRDSSRSLRQSLVELTDLLSGSNGISALEKHPDEFMQLYDNLNATLQRSSISSVSTTFSGLESMSTRQRRSWESQNLQLEIRRIQEQNDLLVAQNQEILRFLREGKGEKNNSIE